ncbi:MAG: hypothetical protein M1838_000180 [Thelocarpon superellum]|nr:MAG: hypothetical protein M1838_000180 [Thelocarpon superellum]
MPTLPSPTSRLRLLRALLRECSYLPDAHARSYLKGHILSRYRANRHLETRDSRSHLEHTTASALPTRARDERVFNLVANARRAHSVLARANEGARKPLLKVLLYAYGRAGRRRHELMAPLRQPEVPANDAAVKALAAAKAPAQPNNLEQWSAMTPRLLALVKSQKQQSPPEVTRAALKRVEPLLPTTDIWERPLPKKREHNLRRNFFKELLERLLPPLPETEWLRLQRLVSGTTPWEGPISRRSRPPQSEKRPIAVWRPTLGLDALALQQGHRPAPRKADRPHQITSRYMRRLWGLVFAQCPLMRWDASEQRWMVQWGSTKGTAEKVREAESFLDHHLFSGVNEKGQVDKPRMPSPIRGTRIQDLPSNPGVRMRDVPAILGLIHELAAYEHASSSVEATEEKLLSTLSFPPFPSPGYARTFLLFEPAGAGPTPSSPAGIALYFPSYSTWRAQPGIWLEDLYVRQDCRGRGYGTRLLSALAKELKSMGGARLEWSVLNWNKPSIAFYKSIGAKPQDEWTTMRVDHEALDQLAEKERPITGRE